MLNEAGRIRENDCDNILSQYDQFIAFQSDKIEMYDGQRLDTFYYTLFSEIKGFDDHPDLWTVMKIILLLSHGQASVEMGFSYNKQGNRCFGSMRTCKNVE